MTNIRTIRRLLAASLAAAAGPLAISPTTVEIAPDRRSAVVEVANASAEPVDLQFRAFEWTQAGGAERLEPTEALVISPAIATVPPGATQLFRVLRARDGDRPGERSFRLKLNELPRAGAGVSINLEFSIPVFETVRNARPDLAWSPDGGGVVVANRGRRRVRIREVSLVGPDGVAVAVEGARSSYLLSGAAKRFALPPGVLPAAGSRLVGVGDAGPIDAAAAAR